MSESREIVLQPGQQADVMTAGAQQGYLLCVKGSAHLATARMGVGWSMEAGDGCLLRTPARYRVVARTPVRLLLKTDRASQQLHIPT